MSTNLETVMVGIAYLIAAMFYGRLVVGPPPTNKGLWHTIGRVSGLVGVFLHTSLIGTACMRSHHGPFNSPTDLIGATGWSLAIAYLVVEALLRDRPPLALGALAFPISFLSLFASTIIGATVREPSSVASDLSSKVISLHVMALLFSFALLFLAVCCAIIYLFEHRLLKQKKIAGGLFSRLPPLSTLDGLSFTLVSLAFPLLTIGILAGFITAATRQLAILDLHTGMSVLTWLTLGVYLFVHASAIERGVRANYILLFGLLSAVLTYFIQNGIHHMV